MIRIILFRTVSFFSSHYPFAIFKIHSVVKIFTRHVHITSLVTQVVYDSLQTHGL